MSLAIFFGYLIGVHSPSERSRHDTLSASPNQRLPNISLAPKPHLLPLPIDYSVASVLGWPLMSYRRLSSVYGWRVDPFSGQMTHHEGLDFSANAGAQIHAASCGVVKTAGYHSSYGFLVDIDHGAGLMTRYAHARSLLVKEGQMVSQGEVIGHVGSTGASTGPHLHFEVRRRKRSVDPTPFLTGKLLQPPISASASIEATEYVSVR